jgi:hypothetical protein
MPYLTLQHVQNFNEALNVPIGFTVLKNSAKKYFIELFCRYLFLEILNFIFIHDTWDKIGVKFNVNIMHMGCRNCIIIWFTV